LTYNSSGYGPWSTPKSFNVVSSSGFNSQFNGTAQNWWWLTSTAPWKLGNWYIYTLGAANQFANIYYGSYSDSKTMYSNFTYEARLYRTGEDNWANGLWFRGAPNPPATDKTWNNGYWFAYTRSGYYSVFKVTGGIGYSLVSWRTSSAVKTGSAWNILKTSVCGSSMYFYINGILVAQVTNSSYSTGKAGFGMYRDATAGTLYADYAKLSPLTSSAAAALDSDVTSEVDVVDEAAVMAEGGMNSIGSPAGVGLSSQQNTSFDSLQSGSVETPSEFEPEDQM